MCKKCKHCGESNLGVTVTQKNSVAVRMLNGEIVEFFKESEESSEDEVVNYCFTCNKEITETDLVETVKCNSCGKEVLIVDENGLCQECSEVRHEAQEEAKKIASMSQEELVAMLMAQKLGQLRSASKSIVEDLENLDNINTGDMVVDSGIVEVEKKEETKKKKTAKKEKAEPAPVMENEVAVAQEKITESVKSAETSQAADSEKIANVMDETMKVDVDTTVQSNTQQNAEEYDILKALEGVELDNGSTDAEVGEYPF